MEKEVHKQKTTLIAARLRKAGWPIDILPLDVDEALATLGPLIDREALAHLPEAPPRRVQHINEEVTVDIHQLTHAYKDGTVAVRDLNLEIRRGEFVAILGQNGSGKTTLVKHLNGLLKPTSGTVTVAGLDTRKASINEMAVTVGFIFQNSDTQICKLKVYDELAFGLNNVGLPNAEVDRRVKQAAAELEITHLLDKNPFLLSMGEKQRVAVASVLAMQPSILVLDEPTTGQDFKRAKEIMDLAVRLHEEGQTIIVITHDMNLAAEYCDRMIISVEANPGGWGAFATGDGQDGLINNVNGGFKDMPVEVFESKYPVQIQRYGFRPDSGGPGKFRGGCGLYREYHLEADCGLYLWFERSKTPAWGLFGGRDAAGPENVIDGNSSGKMLKPLKANNIALKAGDTITINTGGGGGFGNPWERDIELVRRDVFDGYVTREGAERDYGVSFVADGLEADIEATRRLRTVLSSS